jgi:hypothetical protein
MASTTCTSPLALERLGSRSSVRKPMPDSRPTYAGRRLPGHRGSRQASPRSFTRLWFRRHLDLSDASAEGLLSLVSLTLTSTGIPCTLAPTLTTATVNRSSLGWFDGPLLKVDADGPSHHLSNSFHMVLGHYSFPHMLLRHTMEQDRAPPVLPYHPELSRSAAHESVGGRRVDRRDHDQDGA